MGTKEKLIDRLKALPTDFTFEEVLHRPHPQKELKRYAVKQVLEELVKNGDIEK